MRLKVRHVERFKDRHGKLRLYFRIGKGHRRPLRGPEGSPEFWADYHAASGAVPSERKPSERVAAPGSFRWLVEQYYRSSSFVQLTQRTQRVRRSILDTFCVGHGNKRFGHIEPRHLMAIRDDMVDRPEAANALIKALRQVFKYALEYGYLSHNPAAAIGSLRPLNRDGFHTWTIKEVEQFEAKHPIGTKARVVFALLLYTGQRRGDVIRMGRQHETDGGIEITQQKTNKRIWIPIVSELRRTLDAGPTGDLTYLVTAFNKPFTAAGFGNRFRKWCDEAGLYHCSAHGLRKACAARLAERGYSEHQIGAITGHATLKEIARYTRAARQKTLAKSVGDTFDDNAT